MKTLLMFLILAFLSARVSPWLSASRIPILPNSNVAKGSTADRANFTTRECSNHRRSAPTSCSCTGA